MRKTKFVLGIAGAILILAMAVRAGDLNDEFPNQKREFRDEPGLQAALGVSLRVDDRNQYRYNPTVSARLYYFFHSMVAIKGGVIYNDRTELNATTDYRTLAFEVGLRVNARETTVIPFLETGLWLPTYWGSRSGRDYRDYQPGLRLAVGLSFAASDRVAFDLCLSQVLNHLPGYQEMVMVDPPIGVAPCPIDVTCFPRNHYPDGAYNATRMELVARFGL